MAVPARHSWFFLPSVFVAAAMAGALPSRLKQDYIRAGVDIASAGFARQTFLTQRDCGRWGFAHEAWRYPELDYVVARVAREIKPGSDILVVSESLALAVALSIHEDARPNVAVACPACEPPSVTLHQNLQVLDITFRSFKFDLSDVPSAQFDAVVSWHALSEDSDPIAAIQDVARVLRENGTMFLVVPNAGRLSNLHVFTTGLPPRPRFQAIYGRQGTRVEALPRGPAGFTHRELKAVVAMSFSDLVDIDSFSAYDEDVNNATAAAAAALGLKDEITGSGFFITARGPVVHHMLEPLMYPTATFQHVLRDPLDEKVEEEEEVAALASFVREALAECVHGLAKQRVLHTALTALVKRYSAERLQGNTGVRFQSSCMYEAAKELARVFKPGGVHTVCETGFNAGHSAATWLLAFPELQTIFPFDLYLREYNLRNLRFIKAVFPHVTISEQVGNSLETVPAWRRQNPAITCDVVFVDGDHSTEAAAADTRNLAYPGAVYMTDDTLTEGPKEAWKINRDEGILDELRCFAFARGMCVAIMQSPNATADNLDVASSASPEHKIPIERAPGLSGCGYAPPQRLHGKGFLDEEAPPIYISFPEQGSIYSRQSDTVWHGLRSALNDEPMHAISPLRRSRDFPIFAKLQNPTSALGKRVEVVTDDFVDMEMVISTGHLEQYAREGHLVLRGRWLGGGGTVKITVRLGDVTDTVTVFEWPHY